MNHMIKQHTDEHEQMINPTQNKEVLLPWSGIVCLVYCLLASSVAVLHMRNLLGWLRLGWLKIT